MTQTQTTSQQITEAVTSWPGVSLGTNARGGESFMVGRHDLGHLHGDHAMHTGFPKTVWHELHDQGRIDYHPVFPGKPGWAACGIETEEDVRDVIELLRLNYDRAVARQGVPVSP